MTHRMRMFACPECGNPYEAYPPDDVHTTVSLEEPKASARDGKVIRIVHDCIHCNTPITLYWYSPKTNLKST
jgi:hypothetical protein